MGISDYAQDSLSDVVYVELPEVGAGLNQGKQCAVVESVKAAEDIYAPASGEVVAINESLADTPELVNQTAFGEGWFFRVKLADAGELDSLMDAAAYRDLHGEPGVGRRRVRCTLECDGYELHTEFGHDRAGMLQVIGAPGVEELFHDVPSGHRYPDLDLPPAASELEILQHLRVQSEGNIDLDHVACFLGAGAYRHFVPSVVNYVLSRSEFYTAYTPYQPEISQGTLQAIFEYQSDDLRADRHGNLAMPPTTTGAQLRPKRSSWPQYPARQEA